MFEPMKALMMNGAEVSDETRPRHLRVVMSATMMDSKSWNPLQNSGVSQEANEEEGGRRA